MIENTFERALKELENIEGIGSEVWLEGWSRLESQSRIWANYFASARGLLGESVEITDDLIADNLSKITNATWGRLARDWFGGQYQSYLVKSGFAPWVPSQIASEVYQAAFGPSPCEEIFGPFKYWAREGEES